MEDKSRATNNKKVDKKKKPKVITKEMIEKQEKCQLMGIMFL